MIEQTKAMELALEALEDISALQNHSDSADSSDVDKAITALREALAEQQEPVAWMDGYRNIYSLEEKAAGCEDAVIPLVPAILQHWSDCAVHNEPAYPAGKCDCGGYTSPPPPAQRKPLTDEEIENIIPDDDTPMSLGEAFVKFARAIEAAHGIKGNA